MSPTGWHKYTSGHASPAWIGENLLKSLDSSSHYRFDPTEWDQAAFEKFKAASDHRLSETKTAIAAEFNYRSPKQVFTNAVEVIATWKRGIGGPITMLATNRKKTGIVEALVNDPKNKDAMKEVSAEDTVQEIGQAVYEMLKVSTISGKRVDI
ncbi:hypothetical protein [Rhizosaccharibacter radicis]|uniref:Uncharacterized protein n=1 Tax=Rhizosaccharibacter radicis TaxID=2782605 RepID=A0ABT1VST1_9PROT|nr:hypothetical protein [Acetobacteraceae bacterium KSS12]